MKKHKDEDVENLLNKLPSIEDRQSKEAVFQKVSSRVNKKKRKTPPWLLPGMATIAAVVLLAVFIPVYFNNNNEMFTGEESTDQMHTTSDTYSSSEFEETEEAIPSAEDESEVEEARPEENDNEREDASIAEDDGKESEVPKTEENNVQTVEDTNGFNSLIAGPNIEQYETVTYPGMNGEVVLPLVPVTENLEQVPSTSYGLAERATSDLKYEISEQGDTVTVIFPEDFSVSGSSWTQAIIESIRWDLAHLETDTIMIQTESGAPVPLGNYGEMTEIPAIKNGEYVFKLYQYEGSDEQLLAPVAVEASPSFLEALHLMKESGQALYVKPAIPSHVQFTEVSTEEGLVTINVDHQAWASEQQLLTMVEAILATAEQFGFHAVQFEGINVREFSPYNLDEPIAVPEKINPMIIN
ncbi:hypothetical protein SAMN04487936_106147 [Halobacillus dabanensis]|uniref:Sporulation and spore germination n=1 Tax=Halobacillus dabanensis TaxID=240302 RepID=A0A1I3W1C5_HALDA|nr:hypothetical protein [Halobacillus dabanensis]SFK01434.1 hypothetical protein SAMN04487936_106147 [Halobacillus dabanensis]